ncbi:MAG: sodium:proton antiporter [Planctomycetes bacterium]|nr:sodium:proton antiporter [Planctomycetota bacterium]
MPTLLSSDGPPVLLLTVAGVMAGGLISQALARRLRVPAIVPLLVIGLVAGRDSLGWINPGVLGEGLGVLVGLAVAIILFEGGLTLRPEAFRVAGRPIQRLCSLGVLLTWGLSSLAALLLFPGLGGKAALFGALVIVTGPTVIAPLLKVINPRQRVAEILRGEAILVDPIGALLAVLTFEVLLAGDDIVGMLVYRVGLGVVLGGGGALILDWVLRHQDAMAPDLQNRTTLVVAVVLYAVSEGLASESGVLTATLAGLVLGWRRPPGIEEVEEFKGHVVGVLVSMIFILLAANLDLDAVRALGSHGFLLVGAMIFVVRPASVFLSMIGTELALREKLFVSWIAPRGIVAASVSSLFAIELGADGHQIAAMTFAVIAGTVIIQGPTAGWVGRRLGVLESAPAGVLVIGANEVACRLAQALHRNGHRVLVLDTNYASVRRARESGLPARRTDALDDAASDSLDLDGIGTMLAMTSSDAVNRLAVRLYANEFGKGRVRALRTRYSPSREETPSLPPWLFGERLGYEDLITLVDAGATVEVAAIDHETTVTDVMRDLHGSEPLLATGSDGLPRFLDEDDALTMGETLFFFAAHDGEA